VATRVVSEKPYELAYEASVRAIEDQARVLEGLQSRAGALLAVAVVVTSFFGAQALPHGATRHGPVLRPISYTSGAIVGFGCTALLTLVVLLPHDLRFSLNAGRMLELLDVRDPSDMGGAEAYAAVARQHQWLFDINNRQIRVLQWCFRAATLSLVAEVGLWTVVFARGKL
jgi:hypothetical protein